MKDPDELKHCQKSIFHRIFYLMQLKTSEGKVVFNFGIRLRHMKTENCPLRAFSIATPSLWNTLPKTAITIVNLLVNF